MAKATRDALPRREREIMNALFALGNRATAEEIRARLADPPSGSSVRVMLARLEKKGYLRHAEDGVRYVYSATESPDKAKRTALQRLLADLLRWVSRPDGGVARPPGLVDRERARGARGRNSTRAEGEKPMMSFAVAGDCESDTCVWSGVLPRAPVPAHACVDSTPAVRSRVHGVGRHSRCRHGVAGCCGHGTSDSEAPHRRTPDMASAALSSAGADPSGSSTPSVSRETARPQVRDDRTSWSLPPGSSGVALFLIPVVAGLWQMRRLRQVASPWIDGQALVQTLAPTLGARRRIDTFFTKA